MLIVEVDADAAVATGTETEGTLDEKVTIDGANVACNRLEMGGSDTGGANALLEVAPASDSCGG